MGVGLEVDDPGEEVKEPGKRTGTG
jgi:hypothetical protein